MTTSKAKSAPTTPPALVAAAQLLPNDPAKAAELARNFLKATPDHRDGQLLLAAALRNSGQTGEALDLLAKLAEARPDWHVVQYEIGLALSAQGAWAAALGALRRAVELEPELPGAWRALGDVLYELGETTEADNAYERFVAKAASDPLLAQAVEALQNGRADIAEANARLRLKFVPTDIVAMRLLADVCAHTGRGEEAEALLAALTARAPGYVPAQFEYAQVLVQRSKFPEAIARIDTLLYEQPDNANLISLKSVALANLGDFDAAIQCGRRVLALNPDATAALLRLAHLLRVTGARDEAVDLYNRAIGVDPGCGEAWWALANLKTYRFTEFEAEAMQTALELPRLSDDARIALRFALGAARDQLGQHHDAFQAFAAANALKRMALTYDPDNTSALVRRSCDLLTDRFFLVHRDGGAAAKDPIFIVGMPRSGSTLVEQILASHSTVEGLGELPHLIALAGEVAGPAGDPAYPQVLENLDADACTRLGETYLERAALYRQTDRPRFTDKTPMNFVHVGLIQMILPNAKIIDVRRHPMACGFSNFAQLFGRGHDFAYRLSEIGRLYRDYVALMAHYDRVRPGRVHRVIYERLIADPEGEIRALLAHCDLPFEEACLKPHENTRAVLTPSAEQVRKPIRADDAEHWRHYEAWLAPLKSALGPVLESYPDAPSAF